MSEERESFITTAVSSIIVQLSHHDSANASLSINPADSSLTLQISRSASTNSIRQRMLEEDLSTSERFSKLIKKVSSLHFLILDQQSLVQSVLLQLPSHNVTTTAALADITVDATSKQSADEDRPHATSISEKFCVAITDIAITQAPNIATLTVPSRPEEGATPQAKPVLHEVEVTTLAEYPHVE